MRKEISPPVNRTTTPFVRTSRANVIMGDGWRFTLQPHYNHCPFIYIQHLGAFSSGIAPLNLSNTSVVKCYWFSKTCQDSRSLFAKHGLKLGCVLFCNKINFDSFQSFFSSRTIPSNGDFLQFPLKVCAAFG